MAAALRSGALSLAAGSHSGARSSLSLSPLRRATGLARAQYISVLLAAWRAGGAYSGETRVGDGCRADLLMVLTAAGGGGGGSAGLGGLGLSPGGLRWMRGARPAAISRSTVSSSWSRSGPPRPAGGPAGRPPLAEYGRTRLCRRAGWTALPECSSPPT